MTAAAFVLSVGAQAAILSDDFNDGVLDTNLWDVLTPLSDSQMTEINGNADFFQRGVLISKQEFTGPYEIQGRFAFTGGSHDLFDIHLRTDGTMNPAYGNFTNNIYVGFHRRGGDDGDKTGLQNLTIVGGSIGLPTVITDFTFAQNTFYDFRIVDSGDNIALYLVDLSNPILSVATSQSEGNKIGIENRGFVPWWPTYDNRVALDYINIVPEPSSSALLLIPVSYFGVYRRRLRH
jgi:hypothetical protein